MLGKFITLEGTEGAGKSTALRFVADYLQQKGKKVHVTREPGGTPLAEQIRELLLHPASSEKWAAETELLLMFAARAQHIAACILPALQQGVWVVSDRYVDASYAYQGAGRGMDRSLIATLDQLIVKDCRPDLTLLLDLPADMGILRAAKRGSAQDRIEQEALDFFVRVREAYLLRAKAEPTRMKVIDASRAITKVEQQIRDILDSF